MTTAAIRAIKALQDQLPAQIALGDGTEAYAGKDDLAYAISRLPMRSRRPVRIICAGAGFSGISLAKQVESGGLQEVSLAIYEKNASIGGTWYENRYPGCACDIPIHNYQFSWAPYPHFPSYYAAGKDICDYIDMVADQHNLRKYVHTSHKIVGAKWDEQQQIWKVEIVRTDGRELVASNRYTREAELGESWVEECDVFINATGCFNDWKWPKITSRETFQRQLIHSAVWPKDVSLAGQTVALIGNGSTGVQILPAILNEVKKVCVYIRSSTWITAGFAQKYAGPGGTNLFFSDEQKQRWADNPSEYLSYRKAVESEINGRFKLYLKYTTEQRLARDFSEGQMKDKLLPRPDLLELLLPDFSVGCRRATPGNGYLEALCSDKVEVVWGEIDRFDEKGIHSASGQYCEFDTIICATGFNMSFSPRFPIIGQNGVDLQKQWDIAPECYLSLAAAHMPNYFTYLGPGSPLGHGSVVTSLERVTEYIGKFVTKLQTENYSSVVIKPHIPRAYQKQALAWLDKTAWSSHCVSTYKNGKRDGDIIALHPGSRLHFFDLLSNPRWEDYNWKSACEDDDLAFAWMANGFTVEESSKDSVADLTWFLPPIAKEDHIKLSKLSETHAGKRRANSHTVSSACVPFEP